MENKVEVVRYVRGYDKNMEISNLHGITLIFEMLYDVEMVAVSWSVCHETNFSRKAGIAKARENKQSLYLTFPEVARGEDFTTSLFLFLHEHKFLDVFDWSESDYDGLRVALNRVNKILKPKV